MIAVKRRPLEQVLIATAVPAAQAAGAEARCGQYVAINACFTSAGSTMASAMIFEF